MADTEHEGRCLCGAVTVAIRGPVETFSACHCDYCRRWSGSVQMGITVADGDLRVDGPVEMHQATPFTTRHWCGTCGSALYLRSTDGEFAGEYWVAPGLFENFAGARLASVVYADRCPAGLELGGQIKRTTKADYEAAHDHVEDDA